jgi:hypothetical protein
MRHTLSVRVFQTTGNLEREAHRIEQVQTTMIPNFPVEVLAQRFALVVRHRQKRFVI